MRRHKLPAEYVVWLVIGMGLLRDRSIEEVMRHLNLVLPGVDPPAGQHVTGGAIVRVLPARVRRPWPVGSGGHVRPSGVPRLSSADAAQRDGPELRQRRLVVPRQPLAGVERDVLMVPLQRDEVRERRDAVELGGVDEAHE